MQVLQQGSGLIPGPEESEDWEIPPSYCHLLCDYAVLSAILSIFILGFVDYLLP